MAVKKKPFEIQRWMWIVGIPTLIILFARTIVVFADMPKRVDTIESYIQAQQEANRVQSKANELMQQQIQQQQQTQPYCEIYEGATWCWDERTQQWYQPQGG